MATVDSIAPFIEQLQDYYDVLEGEGGNGVVCDLPVSMPDGATDYIKLGVKIDADEKGLLIPTISIIQV